MLEALTPFLADAVVQSTAVLLLTAGVFLLLARAAATTRHRVLLTGIVGLLLLPPLTVVTPSWRMQAPKIAVLSPPAASPAIASVSVTSAAFLPLNAPPALPARHRPTPFSWSAALVLTWLLGTALLLLRLAIRLMWLRRVTAHFPTLSEIDLADWKHFSTVIAGPPGTAPMVWGGRHPVLLLPSDALQWPEARLRAVLRHELAHVRRQDWLTQMLSEAVCALYWFNPLVWQVARWRQWEAEHACDDAALLSGIAPADYAAQLLHVVRDVRAHRRALPAVSMAQRAQVAARVRSVLDATRPRTASRRASVLPPLLAVLLLPLTVLRPAALAAPPAPAHMPPAMTENGEARFLAGLTAVQGPGLIVTLRDSRKPTPPSMNIPGMAPPNLIRDTDIEAVVNKLKAAGAEAMAVNGQRLVATSPIQSTGPIISVNSVMLTAPYVIRAIGNPQLLSAMLNQHGGVADQIRDFDPKMISLTSVNRMTLPPYRGSIPDRYARPVSATANNTAGVSAPAPRSFVILWRAPNKGEHHVKVVMQDVTGMRVLYAASCAPGQMMRLTPKAAGANITFLIYDNGHLVSTQRFAKSVSQLGAIIVASFFDEQEKQSC